MDKKHIDKIRQSVKTIEIDQKSVDKYLRIQDTLMNTDVSKDKVFQKSFKGFYRIRRNDDWCKIYFKLLEQQKTSQKSFSELLRIIFNETGRVEASFTSKLVATIATDCPIWDSFVLKNLGISSPTYLKADKKIEAVIEKYNELTSCLHELSELAEIKDTLKQFDINIKRSKEISTTKKIDFILWSIRS